jgi:hypothetical protein
MKPDKNALNTFAKTAGYRLCAKLQCRHPKKNAVDQSVPKLPSKACSLTL